MDEGGGMVSVHFLYNFLDSCRMDAKPFQEKGKVLARTTRRSDNEPKLTIQKQRITTLQFLANQLNLYTHTHTVRSKAVTILSLGRHTSNNFTKQKPPCYESFLSFPFFYSSADCDYTRRLDNDMVSVKKSASVAALMTIVLRAAGMSLV